MAARLCCLKLFVFFLFFEDLESDPGYTFCRSTTLRASVRMTQSGVPTRTSASTDSLAVVRVRHVHARFSLGDTQRQAPKPVPHPEAHADDREWRQARQETPRQPLR